MFRPQRMLRAFFMFMNMKICMGHNRKQNFFVRGIFRLP